MPGWEVGLPDLQKQSAGLLFFELLYEAAGQLTATERLEGFELKDFAFVGRDAPPGEEGGWHLTIIVSIRDCDEELMVEKRSR